MKNKKSLLLIIASILVLGSCTKPKNNNSSASSSSPTGEVSSNSASASESSSTSSSSSSSINEEIPELTQEMLDVFDTDSISFDGRDEISFYDVRTGKFASARSMNVSTSMDGIRWSTTYEDSSTGSFRTLYYANNQGKACQISVSLMNDEEYIPVLDENGKEVPWSESGKVNKLNELVVSDFTYKKETGRYHYNKNDFTLINQIVSSANPYEFETDDFSLIITDNEIIGIQASSTFDLSLAAGYKAEQTLISTINYEDVDVPTIEKFTYESDFHSYLDDALKNMRSLKNYNTKARILSQSLYAGSSSVDVGGYFETVTENDCFFQNLDPATTQDPNDKPIDGTDYGYHKFTDNDYNAYYLNLETNAYEASRAYKGSINSVKPSFMFAPEIMTGYSYNQETKERYYYSDPNMSLVASTFYYGVGNDINTYSVFATTGRISATESFTPYVVVSEIDGEYYITYAYFYFNLGLLHGVMEISYSDFNTATIPSEKTIEFEQRQIPSNWSELTFIKSNDSSSTSEDDEVNALEYLKTFFKDQDIGDKMPFFGITSCLGDTFGFGLPQIYRPQGMAYYIDAINLYYDVPLDLDYSINSSLNKIYSYLESLGFTNIGNHIYVKGDITIEPIDNSLDLVIYIYRTSDVKIGN